MLNLRSVVYASLAGSLIAVAVGINENSAKERPCFKVENAVDPDITWMSSVKTWYYPLASKLDLYRTVHDLLETDYANIPEIPIHYKSCLEWTINSNGYTMTGFGGKVRHLSATPVGTGTVDFKSDWENGQVGRAYTTLTDNSTFMFAVVCFEDNQASWNIFSTTKRIEDKYTLQVILDHAVSLGFSLKYLTSISYAHCPNHYQNGSSYYLPKIY